MIRMFLGSYAAGATVAALLLGITESSVSDGGWYTFLILIFPIFAIIGWFITPVVAEENLRKKVANVSTGTLFAFYWLCVIFLIIFRERYPENTPFSTIDHVAQFCIISVIAGGFGTMFSFVLLEDRMEGKKFAF